MPQDLHLKWTPRLDDEWIRKAGDLDGDAGVHRVLTVRDQHLVLANQLDFRGLKLIGPIVVGIREVPCNVCNPFSWPRHCTCARKSFIS